MTVRSHGLDFNFSLCRHSDLDLGYMTLDQDHYKICDIHNNCVKYYINPTSQYLGSYGLIKDCYYL